MLVWFLFSCQTSELIISDKCTIQVREVEPNPLVAGQTATLIATPMSEAWDSRISIAQESVLANQLERIGCESCDSCKMRYECNDCFDCDSCDYLCKSNCVEKLTFTVPDSISGAHPLYLSNRFGQSEPYAVEVESSIVDTGSNDSGQ